MKSILSPLVLGLLLIAAQVGWSADTQTSADLPPEVMAGVRLVATAPYALAIASAVHRMESGEWPTKFDDIAKSLEANRSMLPEGFSYKQVKFKRKGKDCVISFAFDWPAYEGGGAEGTVTVTDRSSFKEILESVKVKWKKEPRMTYKKKAEPDATDNPGDAQ